MGGDTRINRNRTGRYQAQAAKLLGRPQEIIPDSELIVASLAGKAFAWDALIERYQALIYTVALRTGLSPTDAEDAFQEVCILLLDHLADLRDHSRLAAWLITATRRESWRRRKRQEPLLASELITEESAGDSLFDPQDASAGPEDQLLALEDKAIVTQAMAELADNCRQLLLLLYSEDPACSYADVSRRLHIPLGSIGPTRARCLQRLYKKMQEIGF